MEFPGESAEYRKARDELLDRELELRRQIEAIAARRRSLPPGGRLKEDYGFEEGTPNSADLTTSSQVRLSELFAPEASNSLIIYGFMFGLREDDALCSMCTSLFGSERGRRNAAGTTYGYSHRPITIKTGIILAKTAIKPRR